VRATLKGSGPGSVILLHDGQETLPPDQVDQSRTVKALPQIIDALAERAFTFVPVTEFLSPI
jgi:peptidoglycan/xylan/chitin deacetylase (PgdA/CDA1 family)